MGTTPAACSRANARSISSRLDSRWNGLRIIVSPTSHTRHRSNGATFVAWFTRRISDDWLRISRGPCRAPVRLVTPPSNGTPMRPMSTSSRTSAKGVRMNVGIPV